MSSNSVGKKKKSIESSIIHFRKRSVSNSVEEKFYTHERKRKHLIMVLGSVCYYGIVTESHDIVKVEVSLWNKSWK